MKFNLVQINAVYLTKDSSAAEDPCKLSVSGLDKLKTQTKGRIVRGLDNTPTRISADFGGRGFDIAITVEILYKPVFDAINAAINTACSNKTTLNLNITGDTGEFNLTVLPGDEPIQFAGEFKNGRIKKVTYNFTTV